MGGCDCAFLSKACGGIVGSVTPPTAPTPPPITIFTFNGRVTSTQTGAPIGGASVVVGEASTQTGSDGMFTATLGTAASQVTVSAPGFLTRVTTVRGGGDRSNTIDLIANAAPFNLDFFDRFARGKEQQPTFPDYIIRWQTNPSFYIITKLTRFENGVFRSTDRDVPQATLDRIAGMLPNLVREATDGHLQMGSIQFRPDARESWEAGFVQVEIAEAPPANDLTGQCGFGGASITFAGDGFANEVSRTGFARMYNTSNCSCQGQVPANTIISHEIGHALGFAHTHPFADSVMSFVSTVPCSSPDFSGPDRLHAALAYTRPVGSQSPDTDPQGFQLQRFARPKRAVISFSCPFPGRHF